jgi:hypothetical protein
MRTVFRFLTVQKHQYPVLPFSKTAVASGDIVINGQNIGAVKAGATVSVQGQNVADAINAVSSKTGVAASLCKSWYSDTAIFDWR